MLRRAFLRRMAFAAWFLDLPLPREPDGRHPDVVALAEALDRQSLMMLDTLGITVPAPSDVDDREWKRMVIRHARSLGIGQGSPPASDAA